MASKEQFPPGTIVILSMLIDMILQKSYDELTLLSELTGLIDWICLDGALEGGLQISFPDKGCCAQTKFKMKIDILTQHMPNVSNLEDPALVKRYSAITR